jgi:hypothetical protein
LNKWLKIGIPVLVAVLLVISAVSITIAVTNGNSANQPAAIYTQGATQVASADQGAATNQVYVPQGKQGSCCVGTTEAAAPSQTFRGCCGAR